MPLANLEYAQLQGASLSWAQLQGADMWGAQLQGAVLDNARLQGADLRDAQLQGANLQDAQLQGADMWGAQLQGANLGIAQLEGANLQDAQLQGANFAGARLQGANLARAQLQGADLRDAQLQGASLRDASLYIKSMPPAVDLVDVRGLKWRPLATATAGLKPPTIESCLPDENTEITCKKTVDLGEFREKVFKELEALACQSSYIAHGILLRLQAANTEKGSATEGLAVHLQDIRKKGVSKDSCPGLFSLSEGDAALLTKLAEPKKR